MRCLFYPWRSLREVSSYRGVPMCLASLSCTVGGWEGERHSTRSHQKASKHEERLGPPEMAQVYGRDLQIRQVVLMLGGKKSFLPYFDTSTGLPALKMTRGYLAINRMFKKRRGVGIQSHDLCRLWKEAHLCWCRREFALF